jgi:hypothetical protein
LDVTFVYIHILCTELHDEAFHKRTLDKARLDIGWKGKWFGSKFFPFWKRPLDLCFTLDPEDDPVEIDTIENE